MPGDDRLFFTERVEEADDIAGQMKQRVLVDRLRPVGLAIAAHIGRHRVEPGRRQRGQLMPPGVPALGKTVAHDDERAFTLLGDVHANAVRLDIPMSDLARCHRPLP